MQHSIARRSTDLLQSFISLSTEWTYALMVYPRLTCNLVDDAPFDL